MVDRDYCPPAGGRVKQTTNVPPRVTRKAAQANGRQTEPLNDPTGRHDPRQSSTSDGHSSSNPIIHMNLPAKLKFSLVPELLWGVGEQMVNMGMHKTLINLMGTCKGYTDNLKGLVDNVKEGYAVATESDLWLRSAAQLKLAKYVYARWNNKLNYCD